MTVRDLCRGLTAVVTAMHHVSFLMSNLQRELKTLSVTNMKGTCKFASPKASY